MNEEQFKERIGFDKTTKKGEREKALFDSLCALQKLIKTEANYTDKEQLTTKSEKLEESLFDHISEEFTQTSIIAKCCIIGNTQCNGDTQTYKPDIKLDSDIDIKNILERELNNSTNELLCPHEKRFLKQVTQMGTIKFYKDKIFYDMFIKEFSKASTSILIGSDLWTELFCNEWFISHFNPTTKHKNLLFGNLGRLQICKEEDIYINCYTDAFRLASLRIVDPKTVYFFNGPPSRYSFNLQYKDGNIISTTYFEVPQSTVILTIPKKRKKI